MAGRWSREEHLNTLELRTIVMLLRHLARSSRTWGQRTLVFSDSVVSIGVLRKGRSSSRPLLRLARVAAVLQMVTRTRIYLRWVPSGLNHADGPSRQLQIGAAEHTIDEHRYRYTPKPLRLPRPGGGGARSAGGAAFS